MKLLEGVLADAVVSDDEQYRYKLSRLWDVRLMHCVFIMLNPSTADGLIDDMTLRKCQGFARRWQFGGLHVVNLFALRATDPAELVRHSDPVGPENDDWLKRVISAALGPIIAAWGHKGGYMGRDSVVRDMVRREGRQLYRIGPPTPERRMPRHLRAATGAPWLKSRSDELLSIRWHAGLATRREWRRAWLSSSTSSGKS